MGGPLIKLNQFPPTHVFTVIQCTLFIIPSVHKLTQPSIISQTFAMVPYNLFALLACTPTFITKRLVNIEADKIQKSKFDRLEWNKMNKLEGG